MPVPLRTRAAVAATACFVIVGFAAACARPLGPPGWAGGSPDKTAPQLLSSSPAQLAVVPDWKDPVVFRFDERISETGIDEQAVVVSPDTGEVKVSRKGREIRVRPKAGWKPGRIYHVVLLPVVRDMFGNARKEPAEIVFSTGPQIPETVIAGMLTDRLTGKPSSAALVQAMHLPDSLVYTTASDTGGFFALRHVPEGQYVVRAFDDRNRDRQVQLREAQGQVTADLAPRRDTVMFTEISLLAGDTTPARLTKAEARDSLAIRLTFDDYLDPVNPAAGANAVLWHLPDSTVVTTTGPMLAKQYEASRAKADTSAAARAKADTSAAGRARPPAPDTAKPLPVQELMLQATRPLAAGARYRVTVQGLTNINGIHGGGGTATFETPAPPKTAAADSSRRAPGRTAAPADTSRRGAPRPAARDSTRPAAPRPVPDTSRRPPAAAPRDTSRL